MWVSNLLSIKHPPVGGEGGVETLTQNKDYSANFPTIGDF